MAVESHAKNFQRQPPYSRLPLLIILMAGITLVIGIIALHYLESRLIAAKGETLASTAADIADKLDLLLYERYTDIEILSQNPVLQGDDTVAKNKVLDTFRRFYPIYRWLGVTDARGRIIASTDIAKIGQDRSTREWFQHVRDRGEIHVRDAQVSQDSGGVWAVAFTAPLRDPQGKFLGVVSSRVALPALKEIFSIRGFQIQQGSSETIEYQFLTRDGDVIVDSILGQQGEINLKHMGLPSALLTGSAQPGYVEEDHLRRHVTVITGYAQTEGYGTYTGLHWGILVRLDRSAILTPIRTVLGRLGLAGIVVVLPLLGFLVWTSARLKAEWKQSQEECARAAAAESALQLRDRAIAASSNGIFITDPNQPGSPIIFANSAFERLTGYTAKDILGYTYRFLQGPDTDPHTFAEIRQALREKRECRVVMKNYGTDGKIRWNDVMIAPIHTSLGEVTHFVGVLTDITDRKYAEEALRESEARLVQFLHGLAVAVFVMDATGTPCYTNLAAERLLGRGIADVGPDQLAKTYHAYLAGSDQEYPTDRMPIVRALAGESVTVDDMEIRRDGRVIPLEVSARPIFNAAGNIIYAVAAFTDISERKRADQRLAKINDCFLRFGADPAENINRLTALCGELLSAPCALYNRMDGHRLISIGQWRAPAGFPSRDEAKGRICYEVIQHSDDQVLVERNLMQSEYRLTDPNVLAYQLQTYIGKSVKCYGLAIGSLCVVYQTDVVPDDADKKLISIIASAIGVEEERRQAEEGLQRLRVQNEMILNSAGEGIYGLDRDGKTTFVNPAAAKMLGWEGQQLLGQLFHEVAHHTKRDGTIYPPESCPVLLTAREGGVHRASDEVLWRKDGTSFPVEYIANPIHEGSSIVGAVVTFTDITERKKADEIRSRLLKQVISAQEEERGRIARELHDETGQSLTALLVGLKTVGAAHSLEEAKGWAESLRAVASMALHEVGRLAWGLRPSVLDDLGLLATLERYATEYADSYAIEVDLKTKGFGGVRLPFYIETTLYRIMQEALTNIAKHAAAQSVRIIVEEDDISVQMIVEDDGRGFDVDETLQTPGTSKGLGLHGMQERALLLDGTLAIRSKPGTGTTIAVRIPLAKDTHGED
jgi:PAS domain S-box-containing protein